MNLRLMAPFLRGVDWLDSHMTRLSIKLARRAGKSSQRSCRGNRLAGGMSEEAKLSILFVNEYFPPYAPGGAEWSVKRLAESLSSRGHRVSVVTLDFGDPPDGSQNSGRDGVTILRAPFPYKMPPGQRMAPGWLAANPLFDLYLGLFVAKVARKTQADVIHAQSKGSLLGAWLAGRLANRPVFLTVRDLGILCQIGTCLVQQRTVPADCGYRRLITRDAAFYQKHYLRHQHILSRMNLTWNLTWGWLGTKVRQWAMNRLAGVIFVSRGLLDVYPESAFWNRARAHVLYNLPDHLEDLPAEGTGLEALRREYHLDGQRVVFTAGKLSPGKGTPVLLKAAHLLEKQRPDIVFLLAGKGRVKEEVPANVRLLGSLPHTVVQSLYAVADVVVSPSVWPEPLSRAVLEAMSAGKPVVGTRVGGTPELIQDRVNGLLVPAGDAEKLAGAVVELIDDPALASSLGQAGKKHISRYLSADHLLETLIGIYSSEVKLHA